MDVKKVLLISQEIDPYLNSSPLAAFSRGLAQGIQEKGAEVRSFMPKYGAINERRNQLHEVIRLSGMNIIIDDTDHPLIIKVATLQPTRLQVYFIDNDDYFYRHSPGKLETVDSAAENDERTMFFVRGTVETVKKLRWEADIVQCAGWITALTPLYLKHIYNEDPSFRNSKIVYSLYNDAFEGDLDARLADKLRQEGFDEAQLATILNPEGNVDYIRLNKLAIDHADAIVESAEGIAPELIEYAKASGKPFLPYSEAEQGAAAYHTFYQSL
ncbi:MAG: glycogen/starch synthase [Muribaculaceae bacterium]|nr:glycogen/starch synthase [Muribaculaceae bacterium]MDE6196957.1 glycogen/starch synthase [Muribaculaceae bacterium]